MLIFALVRYRILVVVPEVRILHHVYCCNKVVARIKLLVKPQIYTQFRSRFETDRYEIIVVMFVGIARKTTVTLNLTSIKNHILAFIKVRVLHRCVNKRIYFLCCHNISFFIVVTVITCFPA